MCFPKISELTGLSIVLIAIFLPAASFAFCDTVPDRISVTETGAIPNDGKDDTDAIQQAVIRAESLAMAVKTPTGSYTGTLPVVYFPPGEYQISRQIKLKHYTCMTGGLSKAIIKWVDVPGVSEDKKQSMFYIQCFMNNISNLSFVGGRNQIILGNRNLNQTLITISNCEFHSAAGVSIKVQPEENFTWMSALLTIKNCKFMGNHQVLENYCDIARIEGGWVQPHKQPADKAVFVNRHGWLELIGVILVPGETPVGARWVDNYGWFRALYSRFGGENAGLPIVYNFCGADANYPYCMGGKIIIKDCQVSSGSSRDKAAVVTLYALPQQLIICDNNFQIGPLIRFAEGVDFRKLIRSIPENQNNCQYNISGNLGRPAESDIPAILRLFMQRQKQNVSPVKKEGENDNK